MVAPTMSLKGAYSDIVNLEMFVNDATGALVDIAGTDPRVGDWRHTHPTFTVRHVE